MSIVTALLASAGAAEAFNAILRAAMLGMVIWFAVMVFGCAAVLAFVKRWEELGARAVWQGSLAYAVTMVLCRLLFSAIAWLVVGLLGGVNSAWLVGLLMIAGGVLRLLVVYGFVRLAFRFDRPKAYGLTVILWALGSGWVASGAAWVALLLGSGGRPSG